MIGHMTGQMKPAKHPPEDIWKDRINQDRRRAEIQLTIDGLHALSRRGLWRVLLFLAVSVAALCFSNLNLFALLPEGFEGFVGDPPPVFLIHIVLAVSSVSALILIAGRVTGDAKAGAGWLQLAMSAAFYPLYGMANVLNELFPVVFFAGLTILVLEHLVVAGEAARVIREERERLGNMI